jgi:cell division protein FtsN
VAPVAPASAADVAEAIEVVEVTDGAEGLEGAEWGLQLQSLRDPATAEREARRLAVELARPTRVIRVDLGTEGLWSRVYVAGYHSAAEARGARAGLNSQGIVSLGPVELTAESPGNGD